MEALKTKALSEIQQADSVELLEQLRVAYLGKTGEISQQMKGLGKLEPEERKTRGQELNLVKQAVQAALDTARQEKELAQLNKQLAEETLDVTLPIRPQQEGAIHPVSHVIAEATAILNRMGFETAVGPEIEDEFHNFTALNMPESHPARQMHDTFYFPRGEKADDPRYLLRTHTSSVQIRTMQQGKPPFRIIAPGRTYRCDSDMTHTPMFHQIEGLYIDKAVTMAQLKGCLMEFVRQFFGVDNIKARFRPSYFPFTEPSAEMDIACTRKDGQLSIGTGDDWLEILGCGMVHPNVLESVGIDPNEYQGFAFGLGVERMAMLKYGMADLRQFFQNDARWLEHYGFAALDIPNLVKGI